MLPFLFLMFLVTPIVEVAVFIKVGGLIGLPATIAIIVANAILGATLLRVQGLSALAQAQQSLARGEPPVGAALDAVGLLVAGALMITPGLVTDAAAFLLLVPPLRRALVGALLRRLARSSSLHVRVFHGAGFQDPGEADAGAPGGRRGGKPETIIDAEFEVLDDAPGKGDGGGSGASAGRPLPPRR